MDPGAGFFLLQRDPAQMDAGGDRDLLELVRSARRVIIEAEGAEHAVVARFDRARPARAQADRQRQRFVVGPQRVGLYIDDGNRLAAIGCGPARADAGTDRDAVEGGGIGRRQARRCERMQPSVRVHRHDGADRSGTERLDATTQEVHDLREVLAGGGRLEDFMLDVSQPIPC